MLPATICLWGVLCGQVELPNHEPASSQLQLGPLQPPSEHPSVLGGVVETPADARPALPDSPPMARERAPAKLSSDTPAQALLREALRARGEAAVQGHPVDLKTLLVPQSTGAGSLTRVQAYWRLATAIAAYHWSADEQRFLATVPVAADGDAVFWLGAARASAKAERAEARLAAVRAQRALAAAAPLAGTGELPLPADTPFVGAYRTHFKELHERGAAAEDLRQIDHSLPVMREVVDAQAEAVAAAAAMLPTVLEAYQQGQASLAQVLNAHERVRHHRRAFLTAVEQYNGQIATYALSLALPALPGEQIAGMLIDTDPTGQSVLAGRRTGGDIQRVSGEEPVQDESGGPQFRTPRLNSP